MNIKRYTQFIIESIDSTINLLLERATFYDLLRELDYTDFNIPRSYSDACKTKNNPEVDFSEMQSYLDSKGFTIDKIKEIFSDENNRKLGYDLKELYFGENSSINEEPLKGIMDKLKIKLVDSSEDLELILNQFRFNPGLDSLNAAVDIYLYKLFEKIGLDKNIVSLGGSGWSDWSGESEEAFIRYRYGYHNTKYGQLMLDQCGSTEEDLRQDALKYLQEYIEYNFDDVILNAFNKKFNKPLREVSNYSLSNIKIVEFSIIEEDRYIIDLHYLCDVLNEIPTIDNKNLGDNYKLEPEDIASEFTKNISDLKIEVVLIGGDLVIYSKFKEN